MANTLFLFCGGERTYNGERSPKPLIRLANKKTLLETYLYTLCSKFDDIRLIVEKKHSEQFKKALTELPKLNSSKLEIFVVENETSTFQKFEAVMDESRFKDACFSYPDIFTDASFWNDLSFAELFITTTPVRTRFPRVYSSPFNNIVKGVSRYTSRMPANPHLIFAGTFGGSYDNIKNALDSFTTNLDKASVSFEVDFLDYCAGAGLLRYRDYYDSWVIADSERDYEQIIGMLSRS
jgi:NDP-sugar pyrophosphorylase family protein